MTPRQQRLFVILAIIIAVTRVAAISQSLFEWDEALFASGVREYDVPNHAPHPPGYPLFVGAAKVLHAVGLEEFRSLQAVVIAGAVLLFPVITLFALELGFSFPTAAGAAAIFAFLPNVWVHGGTGFSDVPGQVLALGASTLLLKGRRHSSPFIGGAALLGVSGGFRTAGLLIGAVPFVLGAWARLQARDLRAVVRGVAAGSVILAGSYAGAALASTSIQDYVAAIRKQSQWVQEVDSFRNPSRPPLPVAGWMFFVRPFDQRQQMTALLWLSGVSLAAAIVRRKASPFLTAAIFLPTAVLSWLNLDVGAVSRYSMAYLPMYALLSSDGLATLLRRGVIQGAVTALVVAALAIWTWPAIRLQASGDSPPVAALRWIRQHAPAHATVYVNDAFSVHARFLLPEHDVRAFLVRHEIPMNELDLWGVDIEETAGPRFEWPRDRLWRIVRQRNFEAFIVRAGDLLRYGAGWYIPEGTGAEAFRWMGREATVWLPVLPSTGQLKLRLYVPLDAVTPDIEIHVNGALLERIRPVDPDVERSWTVPSRPDSPNELRITTSATVPPYSRGSVDPRELGLRLDALTWAPAGRE